jgi:hypothetical protein
MVHTHHLYTGSLINELFNELIIDHALIQIKEFRAKKIECAKKSNMLGTSRLNNDGAARGARR